MAVQAPSPHGCKKRTAHDYKNLRGEENLAFLQQPLCLDRDPKAPRKTKEGLSAMPVRFVELSEIEIRRAADGNDPR
jgi:hypothetical protein